MTRWHPRADPGVARVATYSPYTTVVVTGRRLAQAGTQAPAGACKTVSQLLGENSQLSKLKGVEATLSAKLRAELTSSAGDSFTFFAPSDAAIDALIAALPKEGGGPSRLLGNETALTGLLSYHIVPGAALTASQLSNGQKLTTALGTNVAPLTVRLSGKVTLIGVGSEANVIQADLRACRGVVHVVDSVLLPIRGDGSGA